jgi:hypothetical protein
MNLNIFSDFSSEPFIAHMRIAWQDEIRKQTEKYWRGVLEKEWEDNAMRAYNNGYKDGYGDSYMKGYYDGATRSGKYHDDLVQWIGDDLL